MRHIKTVRDLIDALAEYDDDAEIRVAFQPSWPLRGNVANVISGKELDDLEGHAARERGEPDEPEKHEDFVWIAINQGSGWDESPYAPKLAWEYPY